MSIAKASNKEESESILKKFTSNITSTIDAADSMNKILAFGMLVYQQVIKN